ncbi:EAL domain-containing protein [Vogesella fluminis]|uniref:EAL domain-containing protein n=1 Tax=Vogesella fluminis TaxID=1069161 RepID=A0ABQ3HBF9_9NEIS|nr:EAL domain-containing protein [Vogesella fluminis]GHD75863.1 hypothetical protein GCM10011419_14250 [Vogesella fluminis]
MHPFLTRFQLRPGLLLVVILLVGLAGLWQLANNAADKVDEEIATLTRKSLERELLRQRKTLSQTLNDYAVWDEMYRQSQAPQMDKTWLAANLTGSVYQNLDVDLALLIDAGGGVLYALDRGVASQQPQQLLALGTRQWRSLLRQADRYDRKRTDTGPNLLLRLQRGNALSGQPQSVIYLVAIQRIALESGASPDGRARYLLFARALDSHLLQEMAANNSLHRLSLNFSATQQHSAALALENSQGQVLGLLEWDNERPGDAVLQRLLPQSLLLLAAMLLLAALIVRAGYLQQQANVRRSQRLEQQGRALQQLVAARHGETQVLQEYIDEILPLLAQTLGASRVSVWQFSADQQSLLCLAGVDTGDSLRFSGDVLQLEQHPDYFGALREQRYLNSVQPLQDERLLSLRAHLAERDIRALLDASIMVGGLRHGIICAESRTRHRAWQQEDINFICSAADIIALVMESSARLQAEGELYRQFYYDRATGLPNRTRLQMQLDELIQQRENSQARQRPVGCMMLSLEGLANINELYGRDSGDQLIRLLGERLEKLARNGEMVARHADNRFAMLLLDEDELGISRRTDEVCDQLRQPLLLQEQQLFLRLSTGLSIYPHDTIHADSLLEHAELALQVSRNDPAGNWVRFRPEMNDNWRRRHHIQNDLRQAVARGELSLHYQPYVSLKNGRVAGAEALVRWEHPDLGRIPPGDFIPLAEETGLIKDIGEWVLGEAIRQAVQWRARYLSQFVISVNVSLVQLEDARFAAVVASQLATHHLPGDALELEVTEGLALRNTPTIDSNLHKLRAQGIGIAIDDFGTGYASFSYLRRFPAEKLKIDKQFLDQVPDSSGSSNLVRMIVAMGHTLGASVTGEGIENIRQARFLAEHGGDYAQGYLISRPLPAGDMERFLIDNPALEL